MGGCSPLNQSAHDGEDLTEKREIAAAEKKKVHVAEERRRIILRSVDKDENGQHLYMMLRKEKEDCREGVSRREMMVNCFIRVCETSKVKSP